jgi:hypothetical protein
MWNRAWLFGLMTCVTALSGCGYPVLQRISSGDDGSPDGGSGGSGGGGGGDDSGAPVDTTVCYGEGTVIGKICFAATPTNTLAINDVTTIDTGASTLCAVPKSAGDGYCVLLAKTITVDSTLRATGTKPLVLIANDSITSTSVDALIDVSSKRSGATELGAGYDPATCTPVTTGAPKNTGGGAGGSFTGKGGSGGGGGPANSGGTPGDAVTAVTTLRGGCPGQDGADMGGTGGHGGGAVFLFAVNKIDFKGTINAGGESGVGSAANGGGGGGAGAGGMIGFAAPMITVENGVIANGGGGGEGVSQGGTAGNNGNDAAGVSASDGGLGGSTSGGDGGSGSAGPAAGLGANGNNGVGSAAGGGGGGGGAGLIKAPVTATFGAGVSPAAES